MIASPKGARIRIVAIRPADKYRGIGTVIDSERSLRFQLCPCGRLKTARHADRDGRYAWFGAGINSASRHLVEFEDDRLQKHNRNREWLELGRLEWQPVELHVDATEQRDDRSLEAASPAARDDHGTSAQGVWSSFKTTCVGAVQTIGFHGGGDYRHLNGDEGTLGGSDVTRASQFRLSASV